MNTAGLNPSFRRGLRDAFPLVLPIGVFGVAFGALAVQAGLVPWLVILSSVIIVSGAAQVAMVGLLASGPVPVLLATTGLALRHLPMSAALSQLVGEAPLRRRLHLAWVIVDESFGLTINAAGRGEDDLVEFKTAVDLTLYSTWIVATSIGALVSSSLDPARLGLEVVFPLVFLGLGLSLLHTVRQWLAAAIALLATLFAVLWLPRPWQVTVAAVVAAAIGSRLRKGPT